MSNPHLQKCTVVDTLSDSPFVFCCKKAVLPSASLMVCNEVADAETGVDSMGLLGVKRTWPSSVICKAPAVPDSSPPVRLRLIAGLSE